MKAMIFVVMAMLALPAGGVSFEPVTVKQVTVGVTDAFIPSGFDSKSEQVVVINGYFPNGCYSLSNVKVSHADKFQHEVRVVANVFQGVCTMALIPFQKEVVLGMLAEGKHKVVFPSGDGTAIEKTFIIE